MELNPQALLQEWKKGKFRPAYLLYGEDTAGKLPALEAVKEAVKADAMNLHELTADSEAAMADVLSACNTPPMFGDRRLVLVKSFKAGIQGRKDLAEYLRGPLASTTLVLLSDDRKPEARDAVAAAVGALGGLCGFVPLKEGEASLRLREEARKAGFELAADAAERMVEEAGTEWGILAAELAKLALFIKGRKNAGLNDVLACLGYRKEANPFDFPRKLQGRDAPAAVRLLRRMLEEGSDPFRMLYTITTTVNKQFKAKRLLKSGAPAEQVFRELRLNAYYDRDYLSVVGKVPEARLARELRACLEAEVALKSKSWLDPVFELERLVAAICRK